MYMQLYEVYLCDQMDSRMDGGKISRGRMENAYPLAEEYCENSLVTRHMYIPKYTSIPKYICIYIFLFRYERICVEFEPLLVKLSHCTYGE